MAKKKETIQVDARVGGAVREMGKLSGALQGVGVDVTKLDGKLASMARGAEDFAGKWSKVSKLIGGAAFVGGLSRAVSLMRDWAHASIEQKGVMDNLPFSINAATEATGHMITQLDLAKAASKANALGAADNSDSFARLSRVAVQAAKALGTDAAKATDDLTTAFGRMSPKILDNLGVTLSLGDANAEYAKRIGKTADQLSESEKKTAFQTVAMERLEEKFGAVDTAADNLAGTIVRLETHWEDLKTSILTADLTGGMQEITASIEDQVAAILAQGNSAEKDDIALQKMGLSLEKLRDNEELFGNAMRKATALQREQRREAERQTRALADLGKTMTGGAFAAFGKDLKEPKKRRGGGKRETEEDRIAALINGDGFTNEIFDRERAKLDAQVAAFVEFDQMMADSAADLALAREESMARAMEANEAYLEAQKRAAEEEARIALKRRETQTAIALTVVDATQSQLETLAAAAVTGEKISGKEIKTAARTQSAVLGVQAAMHFARAAAFGIAGSPLAITQALAGAKATAGAAAVLAMGEGFGALVGGGGGGGGSQFGESGAFNAGRGGGRQQSDLNDAPVSPLQGDGTIPAQTSGDTGTAVNVTVQGSVLSEGDLTRKIRDAIRNGAAA